jgi:tRNA(fMet)-specific endonuclease VapC
MKKLVLDTNAITDLFRGDTAVLESIERADIAFLSVFVLGELLAGFLQGSRKKANRALLEKYMAAPKTTMLHGTEETAELYGHLKKVLKAAGTPIPTTDVWIAAHAMETGSILITYDRHFACIPGLRVWDGLQDALA